MTCDFLNAFMIAVAAALHSITIADFSHSSSYLCSGCQENYDKSFESLANQGDISQVEKEFRTNLVKMKILRSFGLNEVPNTTLPAPEIPEQLLKTLLPRNASPQSKSNAKISQAFLVGTVVSSGCGSSSRGVCYQFNLSEGSDCTIFSTSLWFYLSNNASLATLHILDWTQLSVDSEQERPISSRTVGNINGWSSVSLWVSEDTAKHTMWTIEFRVEQDYQIPENTVETMLEKIQPLFQVGYRCHNKKERKRRAPVYCSSSSATQCCLQGFIVHFSQIGWGDFIMQPPYVNANYCRGVCNAHVMSVDSNHRFMMYLAGERYSNNVIRPCCAPSQKRSLDAIIWINNALVRREIPDMTAEACNCV